MKKLFVKGLIIILGFFMIDFVVGHALEFILKNSPDGRFYKTHYSLERSKEEIIIYGSSRAEGNYVSQIFEDSLGMSCWNSGRGGQSLPYMYAVNQAIIQHHSPKIAIINAESWFLENYDHDNPFFDRAAGLLRPFYYDHKEIQAVINEVSYAEPFLNLSSLYAYNSSYYYLLRPYAFEGIDGKIEDKGWKPKTGVLNPSGKPLSILNTDNKINPIYKKFFDDFIHQLNSRGTKVYLVISPDYNKKVINTSTIEYFKSLDNIVLLDHSNNEKYTKNHLYFNDQNHLNEKGAREFSNDLALTIALDMSSNYLQKSTLAIK